MDQTRNAEITRFRVWIAGGQPVTVALEPAEEGTMSAEQAEAYVEAFNRSAALGHRDVCAVAVPVTVEYRGEPRPGEEISRNAGIVRQRA
ncbi:MAG: hypothetical protein HQ567_32490 [Candidatus Nealsonbacteria bacterium]|nr:hypothetical protein [Candidatus Nealsonbacteria bacterium]